MSNKIVPSVYRTVIDQVVASVRLDFDELAVDEEILALLQQKWESKLLASHVADFEPPAPQQHQQQQQHYLNQQQNHHPMHVPVPTANQYRYQHQQKLEQQQRASPGGGGGQMPQASTSQQQGQWNGGLRGGAAWVAAGGEGEGDVMRLRGGNGEEEDDDDSDDSSSPSSPRPPTSSAPVAPAVPAGPRVPNANGIFPGDEQINSDLDDSEDELDDDDEQGEGGGEDANMDIVFCVYDKVQRVKNKWKMVFRDGMGHVNGKDYLFSKCSSDFEW